MRDKIALLMEETGCESGEAELALEMCGYDLEAAVKAIPRLFKSILIVKGKFALAESGRFGLLLAVLDAKGGALLRARAVVSFNPGVYASSLDQDWFSFEKKLYACRLWEGSLQAESLEAEKSLGAYFHGASAAEIEKMIRESEEALGVIVLGALRGLWPGQSVGLKVRRDVLDLGQFKSLQNEPRGDWSGKPKAHARGSRAKIKEEDILILKVKIEEDPDGVPASSLRAGDMVLARVADSRDIAQYLSRLFGGYSEDGAVPILAPVEAVESGPEGVLARVRFSPGVCGDAAIAPGALIRATRVFLSESLPWWKRFFAPKS